MSDPRLLGALERIAHALEEIAKVQREVLTGLGWRNERDPETPDEPAEGRCRCQRVVGG